MIVNGGLFCRNGLSPQGEPVGHRPQDTGRELYSTCTQVAVSREVLPGRQDLPKSATAPRLRSQRAENSNPRRNRKRGNSREQQWEMEILNGDRVDGYELRCERVRRKFRPDIATVAAGVVGGDAFKLTDSRSTASGGVKRSSRGRKMTIKNSGRYQRT
jgi:hypothetical protein